MIIQQLKQHQYDLLLEALRDKADSSPCDASYNVRMHIDSAEYIIRLQPEKQQKIAVLQALKLYREADGIQYELITDNMLLSAFLAILVFQGPA